MLDAIQNMNDVHLLPDDWKAYFEEFLVLLARITIKELFDRLKASYLFQIFFSLDFT
jgi:hypothetical protein